MSSDEALLFSAKELLNEREYSQSILNIKKMTGSYQQKEEVQRVLAFAYAGECGLEPLNLINQLEEASSGSLFSLLMNLMIGVSSQKESCILAEEIILNLSPGFSTRSVDDSFFLTFLSMVKVGVYLRVNADIDGPDGLGDGSVDAGFDVCQASSMSDDDIDQIITGLGFFLENLTVLIDQLSSMGGLSSSTDSIKTLCQMPGLPGGNALCELFSVEDVTAFHRFALRLILNEQENGIGSCDVFTTPGGLLGCCP